MDLKLTDKEMAKVHNHLFAKYPYLSRANIAYQAELVPCWQVKVNDNFIDDIREIIDL